VTKRVAIIITTWLEETKPQLDACIESIINLDYPQHLLDVILVGRKSYQPEYPGVETIYPDSDDFGNSEGMNWGARYALHQEEHPDFLMFLNDDVVLTKNSLANMVSTADNNSLILGPISNCDQGIKYFLHLPQVPNQIRMPADEYSEWSKMAMNYLSPYPPGVIFQSHLYFYAVLIPTHVWREVGEFEEKFKTGPDDIDYSKRARGKNIPIGVCLDALIWHASGVTADKTLTPQLREANAKAWREKHGTDQTFGG
jgi:GT2 family glycosyltransferase